MSKKKKINADRDLLIRAIEIAMEGIPKGGGPFGALITKDNEIISEACNEVVYTSDPTAHAEILAIRKASEALGSHDLSECTLYASCEPCPMCLGAIYWSGIKKIFYAADRNDAAAAGFGDDLFYKELGKNPSERFVSFNRIDDVSGKEVFTLWESYENKISY